MMAQPDGGTGRSALLVLGMHRSGTSALSGVLSHLGYTIPSTMMPAESDNPKGFFESRRIGNLNNEILRACGSSWHDWRPLALPIPESTTGAEFRDRAATLIAEEFADADHIVLKDPRISRVLPIWSDALARQHYRLHLVITYRNPFEVARSLLDRNGFPLSYSLLLCLRYMLDAERATRGGLRAFTSYDRVLTDWRGAVREFGNQHGLAFPRSIEAAGPEVDDFLSTDLRHHAAARSDDRIHPILSDLVRQVSDILERWATGGEDSRDYEALDRLDDVTSGAGWTYTEMPSLTARKVEQIKGELGATKRECTQVKSRLADETKWRSLAERLLADAQRALVETAARSRTFADDNDRQTQEMVVLTRLLVDAEDRLMEAQAEIEATRNQLSETRTRAQAAEERYQAVTESSAWRLTAPMRRVADRLRSS